MKDFLNRTRSIDPAFPVIAVLPLLLLVMHRNWPLPGLNFDSLFSLGLYHIYDMKIPLTTLNSSHYYSRIGAILPGYVVFHLLPTLWATYVLNFIYWYTAVFSTYFTVKMTINKKAAVLTAILMGSYPLLLSSFSAGFNDGPAIGYLSLTLLLLTLAAKRDPWKIWLVAAGMSYAGAVHSNFFLLNFVPFYAAYYFFMNHEARKNALVPSLFFMGLGIIVTTLILGAINLSFGGQFLFFLPSVKAVISYSQRPPSKNPLHQQLYLTLAGSRHLVLPLIISFGGIAIFLINLIKRMKRRFVQGRFEYIFPLLYIGNLGVYFFWELLGNVSPMGYPEYVGFLIPLMFLALGAQCANVTELSRNSFRWLAGGIVVFFVALRGIVYNYTPYVYKFKLNLPATTSHNYAAIIVPIMAAIAVLIILYAVRVKWYYVAFLLCIVITYAFLPDSLGVRLSREQLQAVDNGKKIILATPEYISRHRQRFWIDESSPLTPVYKSVAGIFGGYYDFFKWREPGFEKMDDTFNPKSVDSGGGRPKSGEVLLILTDNPDVMPYTEKSLNLIGLTAQLIKTEEIGQKSLHYYMTFIKVY